jgi:hypothetical protein
MLDAADRLEKLERANKSTLADLALAVSERTPHDYGILKEEAAFLRKERDSALAEVERLQRESDSLLALSERISDEKNLLQEDYNQLACDQMRLRLKTTSVSRPEPSRLEIAAMIYAGVDYVAVEEAFEAADKLIAAAKEAL